MVHGLVDAALDANFDGLRCFGEHVVDDFGLGFGEGVEDELVGGDSGLDGADAQAEAREIFGGEVVGDGAEAVVGAGRAFFADADGAEREVEVIIADEDVFGRAVAVFDEFPDGFAGLVHEGVQNDEGGFTLGFRE